MFFWKLILQFIPNVVSPSTLFEWIGRQLHSFPAIPYQVVQYLQTAAEQFCDEVSPVYKELVNQYSRVYWSVKGPCECEVCKKEEMGCGCDAFLETLTIGNSQKRDYQAISYEPEMKLPSKRHYEKQSYTNEELVLGLLDQMEYSGSRRYGCQPVFYLALWKSDMLEFQKNQHLFVYG